MQSAQVYDTKGKAPTLCAAHQRWSGLSPVIQDNKNTVFTLDRASFNQGRNAQYQFKIGQDGIADTLVAKGPGGVAVIPSQQTDES